MDLPVPNDLLAFLDSLRALVRHPLFWWEVGMLLVAAMGALLVHRTRGGGLAERTEKNAEYAVRSLALKTLQRILFPISMLLGVLAGRALLRHWGYPVDLLNLAVPLLTSLATIRIVIYFLRKTFRPGPAVKAWENLIATSVWILFALHLLGWLPTVLEALGGIAIQVGSARISLLETGELILALIVLWILALWLSRLIEARITRAQYVSYNFV